VNATNRREQFAERIEDFVHRGLGGTAPDRVCGIAIHPIFRDI
jgi:hypothetical protein